MVEKIDPYYCTFKDIEQLVAENTKLQEENQHLKELLKAETKASDYHIECRDDLIKVNAKYKQALAVIAEHSVDEGDRITAKEALR